MLKKEQLARYFNVTFPLGPLEAPTINSDKEIQRLIFDEQNSLYKSMNHDITLIIGRKGSGKTSLLNSVYFEGNTDRDIIVPLESGPAADIFARVVEEIDLIASDTALVEQVSNVWEVLIWGIVFRKLLDYESDNVIEAYTDGFNIRDFRGSPYEMIDRQLEVMKSFPPAARPVPQKVRYTQVNDVTFLEVRDRALEILIKSKRSAFVLLDSLEDYVLHRNENSAALAGLLRCVGLITQQRTPMIFRCCVPAEKYHDLLKLSQNPIKDFQGSILLHWDAGDLWKVAAKRYATYLNLYVPDYYQRHVRQLDLDNRKDTFKFWAQIFPKEIKNRLGFVEKPVPYILRHTQLLPRHCLLILTEILRRSIKVDRDPAIVVERNIVEGVFEAENTIKAQILQAYRTPYEHADEACNQLLRELPTHFNWQQFDFVVSKRSDSIKSLDRWELMELLIEIGAVGRFISETDRYFIAVYEYMVPHRLNVSLRDTFCIHPVFTETYGANKSYEGVKPVYTYWSTAVPDELI